MSQLAGRKLLATWVLLLSGLSSTAVAQPDAAVDQQQWLVERLRTGQAMYRDDLVEDALGRLELIAPEHPDVVITRLTQELQAGDREAAEFRLTELRQRAPGSSLLKRAETMVHLYTPEGQQALQETRLLAAAGHTEQAASGYQALLGDEPPDFALSLEYWRTLSGVQPQRAQAIRKLQELDRQYPGNRELRELLARLLMSEDRPQEALTTLQALATDPQAREKAAELEYNHLSDLPISQSTVRALQSFVERYPDSPLLTNAQENLSRQQRLLADPAWQAGARGKALVDRGEHAAAEPLLRQALRNYPNDGNLHGHLAQVQMNQGRYEEAANSFANALRYEQESAWLAKWEDLKNFNRSLLLLQQGHAALEAGNYSAARQAYQQAQQTKPDHVDGLIGLANVELAQGNDQAAERLLRQAQRQQPTNGRLIYTLVDFYRQRSPDQALQVIDSLPAGTRASYADLRNSVVQEQLQAQVDSALEQQDWDRAITLLQQSVRLSPDAPWTTYRLANLLAEQGRMPEADDQFNRLLQRQGTNPEARYAHGLYLAGLQRDQEALATLQPIPQADWNEGMQALAERIARRQRLAEAYALRDAGQEPEAIAMLLDNPTAGDLATVASWRYLAGDYRQAEAYYQQALEMEPGNPDAILGLVETWTAEGRTVQARQTLEQLELPEDTSVNYRRRYANALAGLGNPAAANAIFDELIESGQADALLYRDAARLHAQQDPQRALDLYAQGMATNGLLAPGAVNPRNDRQMTAASRLKDDDDWLTRSLRSSVDSLYQQQNPTVRLQHDYGWRSDSDVSGLSDLKRQTTILRVDAPVHGGTGFLQAEHVDLNVSKPGQNSLFGTCNFTIEGCQVPSQSTSGTGLAVGWAGERWGWDIGHSPLGFELSNWLGGLSYRGDWRTLGYTLTASRRPMSNSVLSYAGAVDPVTRTSWGGVTANGLTLGLSHDQGGVDGIWASFGFHRLLGEKVQDNQRLTAMTGYYYRLIDQVDERMRTGLTLMYWGYDKGLDEYTLGQGGYYSPQRYFSVGVPFSYARRSANWSVAFESSVGWSTSKYDGGDRLYLSSAAERIAAAGFTPDPGARQFNNSSNSSGVGLRMQGMGERRLTDHLVLGGGINWAYSKDYAPSQAFMYLRYTLKPWRGNLPMPVEPLSPYADWR
ncbi:cellulose synthase complex outer membrane protein BcsC [Halopseudomonas phragmitis]|uniref:Cellulose biosynthesis protein BcsC n=1 Tax=Halopseudomonas phragmitis TaxID=1931241 RepID=A0A1V0B747_9GAMM|nr:cellulose synthase complex outer membrane protein BcsC [Halopseudomonas phragmitis]AQZ95720.1 cellulose biosynthesis protein BcsC [Halopseudomonas phragmitis]